MTLSEKLGWFVPTLLVCWCLYEGAAFMRHRRRKSSIPPRMEGFDFAGWCIRPWGCWALLSLVFRLNWEHGFNNIRTFPFFANLWAEDLSKEDVTTWYILKQLMSDGPSIWIWTGLSLVLVILFVVWLAHCFKREEMTKRHIVGFLFSCMLMLFLSSLFINCIPKGGLGRDPADDASLVQNWKPHTSMLYTLPHIRSEAHFYKHFEFYQTDGSLRATIHGLSHPPAASLTLYWLAKAIGYNTDYPSIRDAGMRRDLAVIMAAVASLNIITLYFLGCSLFGNQRVGLAAAALWSVMPAVLAYCTFAQDSVYNIFFIFNLLLMWKSATTPRPQWCWIILLGMNLAFMTQLNYSWSLSAFVYAVFLSCRVVLEKRPFRDLLLRGAVPMMIMFTLLVGLMRATGNNYFDWYFISSTYVHEWYLELSDSVYRWCMALIGGQFDIWLLTGPAVIAAFVGMLRNLRSSDLQRPEIQLLVIVLLTYLLPLLFGPNPLKMETARCWNWVTALPVCCAAFWMVKKNVGWLVPAAVGASALTFLVSRLVINFAP